MYFIISIDVKLFASAILLHFIFTCLPPVNRVVSLVMVPWCGTIGSRIFGKHIFMIKNRKLQVKKINN